MAVGKVRSTHSAKSKASKKNKSPRHRAKRGKNLKAAKLLLPVWGYRYVRQFLETSLPTLLAPGNIPAVAKSLPCEFVFLTSKEDETYIRQHPQFQRLANLCTAKFHPIDHLITGSNYSTTITLSYTEAIRASGHDMLETCFFFLVSDYIMASGSLASVLECMKSGKSGVQVGNFQVVMEDALPWIEQQLRTSDKLSLTSRQLMAWALDHIHPSTAANMVNFPFSHNSHSNRLFWRVDGNTLIGRFFLMHMICIRPEVTDFVIGASCDYSFIPELCPTGNVEVITDSDEYLVIEMQPRNHEASFLQPGAIDTAELATTLSEWTTKRHRQNADHTIVFHAGELPKELPRVIASADGLIERLRETMSRRPQPFRGHPYWRGAVAAFREATGKKLGSDEWHLVLGSPGRHGTFLDSLRFKLFGRPPFVKPWHPNWPDYQPPIRALSDFLSDNRRRLLIISDTPTAFSVALADNGERVVRKQLTPFMNSLAKHDEPLHRHFDLCLLELTEEDLNEAGELLERVSDLIKSDGSIIIWIENKREMWGAGEFAESVAYHSRRLVRPAVWPSDIEFIRAGRLRAISHNALVRVAKFAYASPWLGIPVLALTGPMLTFCNLCCNVFALNSSSGMSRGGRFSSCLIRLTVDRNHDRTLSKNQLKTKSKQKGELTSDQTREPQYSRCIEVRDEVGMASLGLMTNQVWHDDPRRLGILLARYKFVAKMLSGRKDVGELGCGDAFGSRIVLQEVGRLSVYDFDPVFIDDVKARQSDDWPLEAHLHDILAAPLPQKHDGIYSLDVIEHIPQSEEDTYLANLCRSLTNDGVLIIGTPSLESQTYASPISKAGHVNCKSGTELKSMLEQFFKTVSVFSMNDEVVHTGFYPMAHYLFAMCSGKADAGGAKGQDRR